MSILVVSARAVAVLMTLSLAAALSVAIVSAEETDEDGVVSIVENFLLARNLGDFSGAASWCTSLLELQDIDEDWFVDQATTADWLLRLTQQYLVDTVIQPHQEGKHVAWTERLTRRGAPLPDMTPARITVAVRAVIRDGKIAYMSGPYPAIPLRSLSAAPGEPAYTTHSNVAPGVPPAVLFLGCAAGLALSVSLIAAVGRVTRRSSRDGANN
jgi:hypothetical protein